MYQLSKVQNVNPSICDTRLPYKQSCIDVAISSRRAFSSRFTVFVGLCFLSLFLLFLMLSLFLSTGVPALIVALSLSIAAGRDGVESFVSDE